jgi:phage gpG-like protein
MSKTFKTIFKKAMLTVSADPRTLQIVGEVLVSSAQRSIDAGGRYKRAGSFEGGSKKFEPLTNFSAAFKSAKGKSPSNLLRESGRLRSSITYEVRGNRLLVGSNVVYAGIHQFGGRIRITPKSRAFFKFKAGSAKKPAEREFWARMAANKNGFMMPARPFITIQPEDLEDIAEIVAMSMKKQLV